MFGFWTASEPYRRRAASEYRRSASVISFNHDGLEIARVKNRQRGHLPIWHIMVVIYLLFLVRLVAVADVGPAGYANRMSEMRNGSVLEQASARVMALDPFSRRLAAELRQMLNFISGY